MPAIRPGFRTPPASRRALLIAGAAALAAPAVRAQRARTIRFAHHVTTQSEQHAAAEMFARRVAELSANALAVQVLPAAQMGGQREIIESVSLGTLEMGYGESGLYANYTPPFGIIALPYLYRDFAHFERTVEGPVGAQLARDLEAKAGIRVMNWMTAGYRNTFLRTRPIRVPADFRGVKIRLPEAPVFVRTFATLGAQPTPIPAPEMYSALQTGVVDAMEGSAEVGFTFRIHEVTKFLSLTRHILLDGSFAMNAGFFAGLPKPQQDAVSQAATEAGKWQRAQHFEREKMWLDRLAAAGTLQTNPVELGPFIQALGPLQDEFAGAARGADLLRQIRAL
ncbi:MAG: TRAP transporter substrate-binding protein [Acetobacteraceae bacterium]|nr:TRAP transporter substrate-binding protein [Acetobacteraceae bacterium]